jgi:hypothetical protein
MIDGRVAYHRRELVINCRNDRSTADRPDAGFAYCVASTAASNTASQPQLRVLARRASMADPTNEAGVALQLLFDTCRLGCTATAASIRQQRVAFGALCCVVDILWACAAILVQPLGCVVDFALAEFDKLASDVVRVVVITSQCSCPSLQTYFKATICFSHVLPLDKEEAKRC